MFSVIGPAPEPENCPYCPYYPVSLVDLQIHLDESHCAAGCQVCSTAGCGFVAASAGELANHCKLVHTSKTKKKPASSAQVCIRHILRDTKKYLAFVQKRCSEERYLPIKDFPLAALISHALSVPLATDSKQRQVQFHFPVRNRTYKLTKDSVSTDLGRSGSLGSEVSYSDNKLAGVT